MRVLCSTLGITHLKNSIYHPLTNGLVEWLNRTLKRMIQRCMLNDPCRWNLVFTPLLFALWDASQESTQFSPFQLVYGHNPRGLMQVLWEEWEKLVESRVGAEGYRQEL